MLCATITTKKKVSLVALLIALDVILLLNFMPRTDKGRLNRLDPPYNADGYWTYKTRQGWPFVARVSYRVGFKEYEVWNSAALRIDIAWGSTIVFLAGVAGWAFAQFVVPRIRLRRRGFCEACGYTGNVSGICPECGKPCGARLADHIVDGRRHF
jgi:hypothetical protein